MFNIIYVICLIYFGSSFETAAAKSNYYWRDYFPGEIPYDAVAGCAGRYIGQVHQIHGDLVANIYPQSGTAVAEIEDQGRIIYTKNIRIFCTPTPQLYRWEKIDVSKPFEGQMDNAVKGGYQANIDVNLFIGKVVHEGECKIGKVIPMPHTHKGLWLWYNADGQPARIDEFYILKYNASVPQFCTVP